MNIENLIYAYLAICVCMIIFNTVCVMVFRSRDRRLTKHSEKFDNKIEEQLERIRDGKAPEDDHVHYLYRKLDHTGNLLAFDDSLVRLRKQDPEPVKAYLDHVYGVFFSLMQRYRKRGTILVTFYLYILKAHRVMKGKPTEMLRDVVLPLVIHGNVYCRENALQVLYSSGDADLVLDALTMMDLNGRSHNSKMLTDGLLDFAGDREELARKLWARFESFTLPMQLVIVNWCRYGSGGYRDSIFSLLTDSSRDDELRFSCIRYFGKYPDPQVFPILLDLSDRRGAMRWEYAAIASTALAAYPCEETTARLKDNLHSDNWHIRFNAAQSLETIGFEYVDMIDIFEGDDRYAREILQYRADHMRKRQEEEQCLTV